jgi:multidrug efflux system membrane fusion protein
MGRKGWIVVGVASLALVAMAWVLRSRVTGSSPAEPRPGAQARAVPVLATSVHRRDVPVFLEGLGNVVASKTVTVKPQVDGRLEQVLFREGQSVRRGEVLARIDSRPFQIQLRQGEGALARDQSQLGAARRNLERYRELREQNLVPQQQVDDQAAVVGQLEGAVQIDRAAIETARLNLEYARITSPIDGVTGIRAVDPGNLVRSVDPNGIVVVTQLDPIAVLFTLPQDQLTPVFEELARGRLAVDVTSRDGRVTLGTGELALVDNQINQATSTLRLKAVIANPRRLLWPNQFVNARLRLTTRRDALVLPGAALQRGPNGTFVYVIGGDLTVTPRPVEVALTQGDTAILANGLEEGERVVLEGQNQLRPGSRVTIREPGRGPPAASRTADGGADPRRTGADGSR